jgi:DNA modification methylase
MNKLYYGDNLDVLREHIPDESVDLIYLDPPFNSKRAYNVLFKSPKGKASEAQITAFEDTWRWTEQTEREYEQVVRSANTEVAEMIRALRRFLNESDMMAYLTMMTIRLLELQRVLKPEGTLFLHCDLVAGHYIRMVLDGVFGRQNMINQITWKRSSAHSDAKQGAKHMGRITDVIFWYAKGEDWTHNVQYVPYDEQYIEDFYQYVEEETGRLYTLGDLTGPGGKEKGNPEYEVMGVTRYWRYSQDKMRELIEAGRVVQLTPGAVPRYKRYLDEMPGMPLQDIWTDIHPVQSRSKESLGYPTQKPLALLERIVRMASHPGDMVLDPFCGCGTTIHAAEKLGRQWIGIDITHLAISLIEKRLRDAFPNIEFEVEGTPKDLEGARDLAERDKYQFQWWACSLVNAQPYQSKKRGADKGVDGVIYFTDIVRGKPQTKKMIVSVKGGENVGVAMIRELMTVLEQQDAEIGLFVTLAEPTKPMETEAAKAGFYQAGNGRQYPRLQILTIADLLARRKTPQYVDFSQGSETFRKAQTEQASNEQPGLL